MKKNFFLGVDVGFEEFGDFVVFGSLSQVVVIGVMLFVVLEVVSIDGYLCKQSLFCVWCIFVVVDQLIVFIGLVCWIKNFSVVEQEGVLKSVSFFVLNR